MEKTSQKMDPYEEIVEILKSYNEGLPPRTGDCEECSCHTSE